MDKLKTLTDLLQNINQMYEEEGRYIFWNINQIDNVLALFNLIVLDSDTYNVIENNCYVHNIDTIFNTLVQEYEQDGGDDEYGNIKCWAGAEHFIKQ